MKIMVCGSRDYPAIWRVKARLCPYNRLTTVLHGGAIGVDEEAKRVGELFRFKVEEHLPAFKKNHTPYRVADYHVRNDEMIEKADLVLAFWDGKSPGTRSVIMKCLEKKKNVEIIFP